MRLKKTTLITCLATAAVAGTFMFSQSALLGQGRSLQSPPVELALKSDIEVPEADAQSRAMVAAAQAFLATLSDAQRDAALFAFDDNTQRANWSNFPDGAVQRAGVMTGDLDEAQRAALDALLAEVLSADGVRNVALQLAGEDMLAQGGRVNFGSEFYYASFLGEPSETSPWMFQFGGHHLAINATVVGPDVSFAPMLTGGEPLNVVFEGAEVYTTAAETAAAQALMDSLTDAQKVEALRGSEAINLLLGPGEEGVELAPEGLKGSEMDAAQRALLLELIGTRVGFMNADDAAAKMAEAEAALDDTWFGWWGPEGVPGAAYFRVTSPALVMEYSPQDMDGDATDHAHNIYREPGNDYGAAWIAE